MSFWVLRMKVGFLSPPVDAVGIAGQLGLACLGQGVRLPQWGGAFRAADLTTGRPGRPQ